MPLPLLNRLALLALLLFLPVRAVAQEPRSVLHRMFVGVRLGYGIPGGNVEGSGADATPAGQDFHGMVPLTIELGYRMAPQFSLVGSVQYGLGVLDGDRTSDCINCLGFDLSAGASVYWHSKPLGIFEPWVGVGISWERRILSGSNEPATFIRVWESLSGLQFLNLQLGADYAESPRFSVGPYLGVSLGSYFFFSKEVNAEDQTLETSGNIPKAAVHEWVTFGVRGRFNL
jgi:hypothetical protein